MTPDARVLLVDDERATTSSLAPFLERAPSDVAITSDDEEAVKQVERFTPALVLLDVLMPRLDGRARTDHLSPPRNSSSAAS